MFIFSFIFILFYINFYFKNQVFITNSANSIYEIDSHYKNIQLEMQEIFNILKIVA